MKQNQQLVRLMDENRKLNREIQQLEAQKGQTAFLEQLNAAALGGYCSQLFAIEEPTKAADLAQQAAEYLIEKIIKSVHKAQLEEEKKFQEKVKAIEAERAKAQADMGVVPTTTEVASRIPTAEEAPFAPEH